MRIAVVGLIVAAMLSLFGLAVSAGDVGPGDSSIYEIAGDVGPGDG